MTKSAWQRTGAFVGTVTAAEGYELANEKYPYLRPKPVPYLWRGIYYRALSLFPQVTTPYVVDWHRWVELAFDEEWEDASLDWAGIEHFGKLIGELRESYESR